MRGHASLALLIAAATLAFSTSLMAARNKVYTVARFPVAATAKNAVTAKRIAMEDGQIRAFRSLLKRIVPVSSYGRLPKLKLTHVQDMIEGFSVRSEQNSRTEYLATLEFTFRKRSIQEMLKSYGLPYVDQQAAKVHVIPVYMASWPGMGLAGAEENPGAANVVPDERLLKSRQRDWTRAWRDLDLAHALVPVKLTKLHEKIHADTIRELAEGKDEALAIIREEYDARNILIALAGPAGEGRMAVRLMGVDSVGQINISRTYRIYDSDFLYTAELASIIGLGMLEGRWKSVKSTAVATAVSKQWGVQQSMQAEVEFSGLYEWQQIRQKLNNVPGLEEMRIGRLSARGADITLEHSGDFNGLKSALLTRGLILEYSGGQLKLRSR